MCNLMCFVLIPFYALLSLHEMSAFVRNSQEMSAQKVPKGLTFPQANKCTNVEIMSGQNFVVFYVANLIAKSIPGSIFKQFN